MNLDIKFPYNSSSLVPTSFALSRSTVIYCLCHSSLKTESRL
jgi:hypothetical protein